MKRRDLFKNLGALSVGAMIPTMGNEAAKALDNLAVAPVPPLACTLIPSETEGPFPLDLTTTNAGTYFRSDVRETKTGVRLNLQIKVVGTSNCLPMQNVRVNIWGCDKDGLYSGYSQTNNAGQAGLTYLRGYQMTNANGIANFVTILPGWYTGRICHIHFQCYVSSIYKAVSQLTFPIATKNAIYAANPTLYTKGPDPLTFTTDNIFSDGVSYQLATLTPNATTGGYDSYLEVTIQGTGTTAIENATPETGGQFKMGQNFPNPYAGNTQISFELKNPSNVHLEIYDLQGRQVATIKRGDLPAGAHTIAVNTKELGISVADYAYMLVVENGNGVFKQAKLMTAVE